MIKKARLFLTLLTVCLFSYGLQINFDKPLPTQVSDHLRHRFESATFPVKIRVSDEPVYSSIVLPQFYEARLYQPAWIGKRGPLSRADRLIESIQDARKEGLHPEDYHLQAIQETLREIRQNQRANRPLDAGRLADLDLLLSDAFLVYGSHLLAGRTSPTTLYGQWLANRRDADMGAVLQRAVESGRIREFLHALLPPQPGYARLRDTLAEYRRLGSKGEWPQISPGSKLQRGDQGNRVTQLRARLLITADLESPSGTQEFDEELERAVKHFQRRHGLDADGVVGPATLEALNTSARDRIRQLELNLERWRWLPQDLGNHYILVNIANFELEVVKEGDVVLSMRAITGRPYRKTPVFSDRMTYLVFNPYWNVPHNIAVQDKLPLIKKDPEYLNKQNMKLFQGWGADARAIDPKTIDWSQITARTFNYRLRQDPGSLNALGKVKFMFPNQFNVYLHDTPSRELFARTTRTFSSGCIRLEKPIELAEYLLRNDSRWTGDRIQTVLNRDVEQTVSLPEPIPVHLLYWTAWADRSGTVHFRQDVYSRDEPLAAALSQAAPST